MPTKELTHKSVIILPIMRASYLHVHKPRKNDDPEDTKVVYSATGISVNGDPKQFEELAQLCVLALRNKWPNVKITKDRFGLPKAAGYKFPFRFGDEHESFDYEKNPEYEGKFIIGMSSYNIKPDIRLNDISKTPITDPKDFVSGNYCRFSVSAYAYDRKGNKGVAVGLSNILKCKFNGKVGDPLVAVHSAERDFQEIEAEDWDTDNMDDVDNGGDEEY